MNLLQLSYYCARDEMTWQQASIISILFSLQQKLFYSRCSTEQNDYVGQPSSISSSRAMSLHFRSAWELISAGAGASSYLDTPFNEKWRLFQTRHNQQLPTGKLTKQQFTAVGSQTHMSKNSLTGPELEKMMLKETHFRSTTVFSMMRWDHQQ